MLTSEQVERLEALLAKATPGEWECHPAMMYSICLPDDSYIDITLHHRSDEEETAARDLIVAAVNALPALLQLARAVQRAPQVELPARRGPALEGPTLHIPASAAEKWGMDGQTVALVPVPVKE